ncbi:reverse transcriptase domain-containing protein [Tanacetum coccineum]|uniref:Reverse transcriptase domain-containing protein n=1 Tax=Tanacetum coccineum TaxID=301880 RepID=A0ABQ5J4I0_9ASTR
MNTMAGDGVIGIKQHRPDVSSDAVKNFVTTSGRGRLKEDLESSMWRRSHEADECRQNNPVEQLYLSGGDIYYDPSLLRVKKQKKDDQDEWLLLIFKQIHINLPFLEAMIHMPKGSKVLKDLLSHKEYLEKAASSVKLNEECSAIIQRSLPQKERDPGSFTLPCIIGPLVVKNALADLGASINLMSHSLFRRLGISKLKPTRMSIQLADRSIKYPIGVCENLLVKVKPVEPLEWKASENRLKPSSIKPSKLELNELPEHLEYAFLQENNKLPIVISSALSTVEKAKLLEFKPSVHPQRRVNPNIKKVVKKEVIKLLDAGLIYPISDSPWMLERLAGHKYYCFLDRFSGYFQIPIASEEQEKTTFTCPYETFAYKRMPFRLCNALATFKRCMTTIFHELIEDSMEVFMDDFLTFGNSFDHCLKNLEKMLKKCEETNLMLNWGKCHFMVMEGIVLGHKVSGAGIEVDDVSSCRLFYVSSFAIYFC